MENEKKEVQTDLYELSLFVGEGQAQPRIRRSGLGLRSIMQKPRSQMGLWAKAIQAQIDMNQAWTLEIVVARNFVNENGLLNSNFL